MAIAHISVKNVEQRKLKSKGLLQTITPNWLIAFPMMRSARMGSTLPATGFLRGDRGSASISKDCHKELSVPKVKFEL